MAAEDEANVRLFISPFASRPPVLRFGVIDGSQRLPQALRSELKWLLQPATPRLVRRILTKSGFSNVAPTDAWLGTWGRSIAAQVYRAIRPGQKINHFPACGQLGRKDRLARNIRRMKMLHGHVFDFMPLTFCLPTQYSSFRKAWQSKGTAGRWIVKPNASSQGKGICVVNHWNQINPVGVVVQQYLEDPYLIDGYKFDLRIYAYVSSYDPLRLYISREGLARFATVPYSTDVNAISNRFMHLTNYSLNKDSEDFEENNPSDEFSGYKWALQTLLRRLADDGVNVEQLWTAICEIVVKTFVSVEGVMNSSVRNNCADRRICHELYGFDIILDKDAKPHLIEVNVTPSMAAASPLDQAIKGQIVQDVLNLAGVVLPSIRDGCLDEASLDALGCTAQQQTAWQFATGSAATVLNDRQTAKYQAICSGERELASALNDLTDADVRMLMETEEELSRRGKFERLLPSSEFDHLLAYTTTPRYYNMLLSAWTAAHQNNPDQGLEILQRLDGQAMTRLIVNGAAAKPNSSAFYVEETIGEPTSSEGAKSRTSSMAEPLSAQDASLLNRLLRRATNTSDVDDTSSVVGDAASVAAGAPPKTEASLPTTFASGSKASPTAACKASARLLVQRSVRRNVIQQRRMAQRMRRLRLVNSLKNCALAT